MPELVGRTYEIDLLRSALKNNKSDLIAVYGRRRIGKTFLIREVYKKDIIFEVSGLHNGTMSDQLQNFTNAIVKNWGRKRVVTPASWLDAFALLEAYLNSIKTKKKKVIFIDEFPWMATAKSKFLMMFENFWNSYCTKRNDLIVVICGSAASYMIQKVIKNKGGLHNRISQKVRLLPFTLSETELFLKSKGIKYTHYDICQIYMVMGGVPHYLEKLRKGLSVAQNVDRLCFEKDGILRTEFDELYQSLFDNSDKHMAIIKALSTSNKGITRQQLIEKSNIFSGGDFSSKMEELIESGFVSDYTYYGNKKQLSLYRLSDEYSRFYLQFIFSNKDNGAGTWIRLHKSNRFVAWSGFCFETLCLKHVGKIKQALRIEAIYSTSSSWFNETAQIDLLIDRDDNIINLCEMKFYNGLFSIDKSNYLNIKNKVQQVQKLVGNKKNIFVTMITTFGIKENGYSNELVQNSLLLEDLF